MPKHKQPDFVVAYNTWRDQGGPKCCHTCIFYDDDGMCKFYDNEPPEDFAATVNLCEEWGTNEVPF